MTSVSPDFREHLAGECTTVCQCWRLARRDGVVFGFTDHDLALTVDGQAYEPESGFAQSEARASTGMAVDGFEVEGALSSGVLSEEEIAAGLFDGAEVTTLLVNWRDVSEFAVIGKSVIGKITRSDGRFLAELESVARSLDRPNGRYLRRNCDAQLGDHRCKANIEGSAYHASGTVRTRTAAGSFRVTGLGAFAPGWFSFGMLRWESGAQVGRETVVMDHRREIDGVILSLPADAVEPTFGDTFSITVGCDKRFQTCREKFANAINFRGFPHLPGNDAAYAYVTENALFDGKALVE